MSTGPVTVRLSFSVVGLESPEDELLEEELDVVEPSKLEEVSELIQLFVLPSHVNPRGQSELYAHGVRKFVGGGVGVEAGKASGD